jgi:hypothetical protein
MVIAIPIVVLALLLLLHALLLARQNRRERDTLATDC